MTAARACDPHAHSDTYALEVLRSFNRYVLDITAKLGNMTLLSDMLSFCCLALLIASVLIIVTHLLATMLSAICRTLGVLAFMRRLLTVIENEFAAGRGLLVIMALLSSALLLSSVMPIMYLKTPFASYMLITLALLFVFVILL